MKKYLKKLLIITCIFTLLCAVVPVQAAVKKKIILDTTKLELNVGGAEQLIASTKPFKKGVVFTWKSSDEDVVKIFEDGNIFGAMTGEAIVTVSAKGYKKAKCKVTVVSEFISKPLLEMEKNKKADIEEKDGTKSENGSSNEANKIVLDSNTLDLRFAFTQKITATTNNGNKDVDFTWESSNDKVAKVFDNGYVFGNGVGEATIKVSAEGYEPAECKVIVAVKYNSAYVGDPNKKIVYEEVLDTKLADYDQKTITGGTLKLALKDLKGTPYIVAVATKAFMDCTRDTYVGSIPYNEANIICAGTFDSAYEYNWAINYNALIAEPYLRLDWKCYKDALGNQQDYRIYYGTMKLENGVQVYNNNYDDLLKEGNSAFVSELKNYKGMLIRNEEGKLLGILFTEK